MIDKPVHIVMLEDSDTDFQQIYGKLTENLSNSKITRVVKKSELSSILKRQRPDLVLSELTLGDLHLRDVLRELNSHDFDVPVILVTNNLNDEQAVDLLSELDVSDYVLKDNLVRLVPILKKEYKNSQVKRELEERNQELENLSLVASHTHNGVIITDKERRIEWVNRGFTQMTGYKLHECKGKSPGELLQGEETDPDAVARISKKLKMRVPFSEEILNYHKNGKPYIVKLDITPIFDESGEIEKYISIQEDVTKRIKTESALLDSNKRFLEAQRVAKIGDWSYDLKKNSVEWSPQMYSIYNRDRSLGPPSFSEFVEMTDSDQDNNIKDAVLYSIKTGAVYDLNVDIKVPETKHIRTIGMPRVDDEGNIEKLTGIVQDITKLKQAEAELSETSELLDRIVNNLNSTVLRYALYPDKTSEILYVSDGVENLYGITRQEAIEDDSKILTHVHHEDKKELEASIIESANSLTAWDQTWRQIMNSGEIKYLKGRGIPVKQKEGTVIWDTIIIDETPFVLEEKRKKELENLLTDSVDEIFIFDAKTLKFDYCNKSALSSIGYSSEEMNQLTPLDIKPQVNFDEFKGILELTRSKSSHKFETVHQRKDGSTYHVLINLRFDRYKHHDVYVAHTQDITEFVEAQKKVQKFRTHSELAVEGAEVGLWELNLRTMDTFFNEMFYEMLGYSEEDVTFNKSFHDKIIHPRDAEIIERHMMKILANELDGFEETIRLKSKSGEYRWILDKAKIIERDENGLPVTLAGTHVDITNIVRAVEERNVLLQEVHHRVKNNLAIISGLIDLQMMKSSNNEQKGLLDTRKRIQAIATVHEQLYNTDNFSEIRVDEYFTSLIDKIKETIFDEEQPISIDFKSGVDVININQAVPLGLLINELISNSVKYGFSGESGKIEIRINKLAEGRISFRYEDSGDGIDEDSIDLNKSFGFELVRTLINQLADDFNMDTEGLFKLQFDFKKKDSGAYSNINNLAVRSKR